MEASNELIHRIWPVDELARRYRDEMGADIRDYLTDDQILIERDESTGIWRFSGCEPGDGKFYEQIAENPEYYIEDKWEFGEALRCLKQAASNASEPHAVLEIGCGTGAFLARCRDAGYERVHGLEFNDHALSVCAQKGLDVSSRMIEDLDPSQQRYDFVCAFQVLEHVPNPVEFLRTAANLLKPTGQLVVSTPNAASFLKHFQWNLLDLPPHHMSRWDETSYQNTAGILGLDLTEIHYEPLADYHHKYFIKSKVQRFKRHSLRRVFAKLGHTIAFQLTADKSAIRGHTMMVRLKPSSCESSAKLSSNHKQRYAA